MGEREGWHQLYSLCPKFGLEEFWPIASWIWKLDKVGVGGMHKVILLVGKRKILDKDTCFPFDNTKLMDGRALTLEILFLALLELPPKLSEILNLPHIDCAPISYQRALTSFF